MYRRPTLVSFNGRTFDVPLLELAAFRYGISNSRLVRGGQGVRSAAGPLQRPIALDLCELLTNFGSTRFTGGLNLAANLLGKPGKMDVQGHMSRIFTTPASSARSRLLPLRRAGHVFCLPPTRVLVGQLGLDAEQAIIAQTKSWLEQNCGQFRPTSIIWSVGATGSIPGRRPRKKRPPRRRKWLTTSRPSIRRRSLAKNLDQHPLVAVAVELAVEDLLPGPKSSLPW